MANRPISPHMSIYQPQLTWLMSIGHRMTGAGVATGLYAGLIAYSLVGPRTSLGNGQLIANMRKTIKDAPLPLLLAGKAIVAAPISYHYWNGIRHLMWDVGLGLSLRGVYASGWAVNALTLLCTGYLSLFK